MIVNYDSGKPGSGKTFRTTKRLALTSIKCLYAVDRIEVFDERERLIKDFCKSKKVKVIKINSDVSYNVRQEIKDAPDIFADEKHIVVIVSHEALMTSDLSHYNGWHLFIDEIPNAWVHCEVRTKESKALLEKYFSIRKPRTGSEDERGNRITVKENIDIDALACDSYLNQIMALYKAAKNNKAYCGIDSFEGADKWDWWTIWNFMDLEIFESVSVVANAFEESLTFKIMGSQGVQFKRVETGEFAEYKPRKLTIRYFDKHNRATSYFFGTQPGKDALSAVGEYLRKNPVDIWSCNHAKRRTNYAKLLSIKGEKLNPCVAGTNEYAVHTSAAFIFSAKPSKTEIARLAFMEINFEDVVRSREIEPAIQFVTRLSNRNPDDDRDNTFYVYDKVQAECIKAFFDKLGIGVSTELEFVDLMIPAKSDTADERKAKRVVHDRAMYERKKATKLGVFEEQKVA